MRLLLAPLVIWCWIGAAAPVAAQISVDLGVGGIGVGVDIGSGAGSSAPAGSGGGGSSGSGSSESGGISGAASSTGDTSTPDILVLTPDAALDAVRSNRALPLEQIMSRAEAIRDGAVIDAQLLAVRSILVYELKLLEESGDVVELYFYARSGEVVR